MKYLFRMRPRKECAGVVGGGGAVAQGEEAATRQKADLIFDCFFFLLLSSCLWLKCNVGVWGVCLFVCVLGGGGVPKTQ